MTTPFSSVIILRSVSLSLRNGNQLQLHPAPASRIGTYPRAADDDADDGDEATRLPREAQTPSTTTGRPSLAIRRTSGSRVVPPTRPHMPYVAPSPFACERPKSNCHALRSSASVAKPNRPTASCAAGSGRHQAWAGGRGADPTGHVGVPPGRRDVGACARSNFSLPRADR
jgi:hypothetical protein